ncbi:hypothetical protein E2562_014827 [Oryza meyeriana var. granulata]|uniref:Uncharacterized protein n=1 Tax=Oryza meyeriana var. granulata TaxID=110450 RepID=A0A6G1BWK1_9ORYZ|nr:hypothetical protein E2562_014827 [Oryza meyeriana var. granulata]
MQRQLSISAMPRLYPEEEDGDDLEAKPEKAPAVRSSAKERSVHLIPLLTVLCFVLLFLFSHDPSASDMSSFEGKARNRKHRLF